MYNRKLVKLSVIDIKGNTLGWASVELARKMIDANFAYEEKEKIVIPRSEDVTFFKKEIFDPSLPIVVAFSGKTSIESDKIDAEQLVKEGLAKRYGSSLYIRTTRLAEFREMVYHSHKKKCHYCGKKSWNTYSSSNVMTLKNTVPVCISCEQKRNPDEHLYQWMGFRPLDARFVRDENIKAVWLYEKNNEQKYLIKAETADTLIVESMAKQNSGNSIRLLYTETDFKVMIDIRDEKKCVYCNGRGRTIDHLVPKSRGGITTPKNCVRACKGCNKRKNNLSKDAYISLLLKEAK